MRGTKLYAMFAAMFMTGAFLASPELRAYASTIANDVICNGCVNTDDLAGSSVTNAKLAFGAVNSAKIADNSITASDIGANAVGASEIATDAVDFSKIADNSISSSHIRPNAVGTSEIATDSVGASELQGVGKLMFIDCVKTFNNLVGSGAAFTFTCSAPGISGANVVASHSGSDCFAPTKVKGLANSVIITLFNRCQDPEAIGTTTVSIIAYDT